MFVRAGDERLPIRQLFGPSLAREVERGDAVKVVTETAQQVFEQRLQHEVKRLLKGHGGE